MGLAFVCAIMTMAITVKMAQVGALDAGVKQNLIGFDGTDDEIAFVLKVRRNNHGSRECLLNMVIVLDFLGAKLALHFDAVFL